MLAFTVIFLSVVGDIPVDSEVPVVTSLISRYSGPVFGGAHRGRVCMCAFIGASVRTYVDTAFVLCFLKK